MLPGIGSSTIGKFKVRNSTCSYCDNKNTQEIFISGKYLTLFWIPLFPIYKNAVSKCTHCKKTTRRKNFKQSTEIQYQENKILIKRPIWHWIGTIIFLILLSIIVIIGKTTKAEKDYRRNLLYTDENLMLTNPVIEKDPVSTEIKKVIDSYFNHNIDIKRYKYLTKIKEDKALILVQIPNLRKMNKKSRYNILRQIESVTNNHQLLKNKSIYIGIKGIYSIMVIKTPSYEGNSKLASRSNLYSFYGTKPIPIDSLNKTTSIKTKNPENK